MCTVAIAVGAAIGAATSAMTGQDPLLGAVIGGATAGFMPGGVGVTPLAPAYQTASSYGFSLGSSFVSYAGVASAAGVGLAGGMAMNMLSPQQRDYNQVNTGMPYTPQAYSSQHSTVTGSGGRQAAAVLASEIKQAKKLRQRQAEVADFGLGMDLAGTGLQIA